MILADLSPCCVPPTLGLLCHLLSRVSSCPTYPKDLKAGPVVHVAGMAAFLLESVFSHLTRVMSVYFVIL